MSRYLSDAQWKDLKLRVGVGALLVTIGVPIWLLGPGLEGVLDHARAHKTEHWAAQRYYDVAQVMEWTFREKRAQEVYEEFYLLYCGSQILEEEELFSDMSTDPRTWYFMPWVEDRYDEEIKPRPAPVSKAKHPLMGQVLAAMGNYYEDHRLYGQSDHLFACLRVHWEPGTPEHLEGRDGWKRSMIRSF